MKRDEINRRVPVDSSAFHKEPMAPVAKTVMSQGHHHLTHQVMCTQVKRRFKGRLTLNQIVKEGITVLHHSFWNPFLFILMRLSSAFCYFLYLKHLPPRYLMAHSLASFNLHHKTTSKILSSFLGSVHTHTCAHTHAGFLAPFLAFLFTLTHVSNQHSVYLFHLLFLIAFLIRIQSP